LKSACTKPWVGVLLLLALKKNLSNVTLIKSISGIRGTIGGKEDEGLTPIDVVKYSAAYCSIMQTAAKTRQIRIVIGRDARVSGPMVANLVAQTLIGMGADVIDLGLSTTPSVEVAVKKLSAHGGIILTASHNPGQWNALKLLNAAGEFISAEQGKQLLDLANSGEVEFASVDQLGQLRTYDFLNEHIQDVLALPLVDIDAIRNANLNVAVDAVNSSGGIYVPALLKALGVEKMSLIYCEPNGLFPHNPEPLPEHLTDLSGHVIENKCDMGITVDPDVDRLAFVCEDGTMFGEEYTLVAVADYVLSHRKGNTVSNLSSTRALRDVTLRHGGSYTASAVGEVNVVKAMKDTHAVIGGEGNGGVIYPDAHYGRDALAGIALFLSHFAKQKLTMSQLRDSYPKYVISKNKIDLVQGMDVDGILERVQSLFSDAQINTVDGVKFDFPDGWVHLRKSNTEPIVRVYAEHQTADGANALADRVIKAVKQIAGLNE
jgi:phosphomannomutase